MAAPRLSGRPDVVLLIVDCARAAGPDDGQPPAPSLVADSPGDFVQFPRAVTGATWSLPSHASIFTGLYPWNHGCHNLSALRLPPQVPTLATRLRAAGYATASFSSNSVLCPGTGLLQGFDFAAWGRWSENILRVGRTDPPHLRRRQDDLPPPPEKGPNFLAAGLASGLRHFPALGAGLSRLADRLGAGPGGGLPPVSSWIEPSVAGWASSLPPDVPAFAAVNLMDLHEPYVPGQRQPGRGGPPPFFSWVPQDGRSYANRKERMAAEWVSELRDLYSRQSAEAAHRVGALWHTLQRLRAGRPILFAVLSDHGQSLGEDGWYFHSHGQPRDELIRVPLAIHFPTRSMAEDARRHQQDWVSLVDLVPTIASVVGGDGFGPLDGTSLLGTPETTVERGVFSVGDGPIRRGSGRAARGAAGSELRAATCVSFVADTRVTVTGHEGGSIVLDRARVGNGSPPSYSSDGPLELATRQAASAVRSMLAAPAEPWSDEVSRRLTTWGYG